MYPKKLNIYLAALLWIWELFLEILNIFWKYIFIIFCLLGNFCFFPKFEFSIHFFQYNILYITISGITKFKMSAKSKMAGKIHVLAYNSEFISQINTQNCTWTCMVSIQCSMYNNIRENGIINN